MNYVSKYLQLPLMLLTLVTILLGSSSITWAKPAPVAIEQAPWIIIDIGPTSADLYAFNSHTIHYAKNADGTLNKNIIVYEEMKSNNQRLSTQYQYYTITQAKINIADNSIYLGNESYYTDKGKFRWTDEPIYPTWITVSPGSIGNTRLVAIKKYVDEHPEQIIAQSQ